MLGQPLLHFRMLMGSVVVQHEMNSPAGGRGSTFVLQFPISKSTAFYWARLAELYWFYLSIMAFAAPSQIG